METWTVLSSEGAVKVSNQRTEAVRVLLDGKPMGTVNADSQRRLELTVGRHLVELIGAKSTAHFSRRVKVRPDRTLTITIPKGPSALAFVNDLEEAVAVRLGERHLGRVPPKTTQRFEIHERGTLEIIATTEDGARAFFRRLKFDADQVQHWHLRP